MYRHVADTGAVPDRAQIDDWAGGVATAHTLLAELHERHLVVLDDPAADVPNVAMMLPFAAADTGHRVRSGDRSWWANCAWDSFAIPIALGVDAHIDASWLDTGEPVDLAVRHGELASTDGFVQWRTPARSWWDDIADT